MFYAVGAGRLAVGSPARLRGVRAVSKVSSATLVAVVLFAGLAYLAFDPDARRSLVNWVRSQVSGTDTPKLHSTGYVPIVPGR